MTKWENFVYEGGLTSILAIAIIVGAIIGGVKLFKHSNKIGDKQEQDELELLLSDPHTYEITYIDGFKDTITVIRLGYKEDIEYHSASSGSLMSGGSMDSYIEFVPYKEYTERPTWITNSKKIYNVMRYKEI